MTENVNVDEALKYFEGLTRDTAWNFTGGLFGLDNPSEMVQEWRAENPTSAFLSSLVPMALAETKAISLLGKGTKYGKWAKGLASAENTAKAPFVSRLASEAALLAPVELGRQGIGYAAQEINPEWEGPDLKERLAESALNIGAGGLIGGGIGWISSGGKRIKLPEQFADISSADSWQQNLRKARAKFANIDPEHEQALNNLVTGLEKQVREETRTNLINIAENENLAGLNKVFQGTKIYKSKQYIPHTELGFKSITGLERTIEGMKHNGILPNDWLDYVQFPRELSASSKFTSKHLDETITSSMADVGNGWRLAKEKNGLYIIAKKTGEKGKWFIAKTDDPAHFMPHQANLKRIADSNAWRDPDTIYNPIELKDSVLNRALKFSEFLGDDARLPLAGESKTFEGLKKVANKLGWQAVEDSELLGNIKTFVQRNFEPTAFKFKNSPLARKIYAVSQDTLDTAKRKAQELVYGKPQIGNQSVWSIATKGIPRDEAGAFANKVRQLASKSPSQFDALLKVIDNEVPIETVAKDSVLMGELGSNGFDVLKTLQALSDEGINEITKTAEALHIDDHLLFPLRKGHYGISHYWRGSLRQAVLDEKGHLVAILSGDNRKAVQKMAKNVVDQAANDGRRWRQGDFWQKDRALDLKHEKLLNTSDDYTLANSYIAQYAAEHPDVAKSSFFYPRAGVQGYNRAHTAEELIENLSYSLENKYIWLAKETNARVLAKDIATLGIDDPRTAVMLQDTLTTLNGEQGIFSQLVNKTADSILAPVLGVDSANKIVRTMNKVSAQLDLGFGNLAYAMANILQPITTVLPQLALMRECPQALQWAYDGVPLISKSGKGMVANTFSPMKIMYQATRLMANPKLEEGFSDFVEQMVRDGALSPRFIESYIGENSGLTQGLVSSYKAGDYSGVLKSMATMLPTFSEQASRGYAMTVGYKLFNSMYKAGMISKEQVYLGAKKFTENTMFQFAASDRARILQGPVGQAWGLFKNWTMHYVGWQMQYLDAGIRHNAWKPYMYSNLATSMLGGMGSSEIGATLERFTEWATGDKMSNLLYDEWGDNAVTNTMLFGIPGAFGFSLQSQVNSPFRDPGEETQRFMGFVWGNRLKALWDGVEGGIDYYAATGQNPANDRKFQMHMMRALAPKMMYRSTQVVNNTLYSGSSGSKLVDLTPLESLAYKYFNLPSTRIDQAFDISRQIWESKDLKRKLTTRYSEAFTDALYEGDGELMYRLTQRALLDGVDIESVVNGAQARLENKYLTPIQRNVDYYSVWGPTALDRNL